MEFETDIQQSKLSAAIEAEEMNLFSILKPKIFIHDGQWCVLYGDDIQSGICGFGISPEKAVWDFNKAWAADIERVLSYADNEDNADNRL
jgi:hypothetical protein